MHFRTNSIRTMADGDTALKAPPIIAWSYPRNAGCNAGGNSTQSPVSGLGGRWGRYPAQVLDRAIDLIAREQTSRPRLPTGNTVCHSPGMTIFDDLQAEQDRLAEILAGLDEGQWASPSGARCGGSVRPRRSR